MRDQRWQRYILVNMNCVSPNATEVCGFDSPNEALELYIEGWLVYSMFAGKGHLMKWDADNREFVKA
jgi:hypothetical protein